MLHVLSEHLTLAWTWWCHSIVGINKRVRLKSLLNRNKINWAFVPDRTCTQPQILQQNSASFLVWTSNSWTSSQWFPLNLYIKLLLNLHFCFKWSFCAMSLWIFWLIWVIFMDQSLFVSLWYFIGLAWCFQFNFKMFKRYCALIILLSVVWTEMFANY